MPQDSSIGKNVIDRVVGPLFGAISGYFNLPAYLRLRWAEIKRGKKSYFHEDEYWRDVLGGDFHVPSVRNLTDGCVVDLQQFELSEWFPRAPGSFWTKRGYDLRMEAKDEVEFMRPFYVHTPRGKQAMIEGGIGTLRLEPHGSGDVKYKILGATSSGNLSCGVPVVVPLNVYEKVRDRLLQEGSVSATITGVYASLPVSAKEMALEAAGVELPAAVKSWIVTSYYVPRNCVLVESILLIENVRPGLGVKGAAWSVYESPERDYGWTYASFDPRKDESLNRAVRFLNEYVAQHGAGHFLTEFDEKTMRLNAEWSISDVVAQKAKLGSRAKSILDWGQQIGVSD